MRIFDARRYLDLLQNIERFHPRGLTQLNPVYKTRSCDVLVVGAGGSGLAAAVEAATTGADVAVMEKADSPLGSTGRSVGAIAASGTPDQRSLGVVDSAAAHLQDYRAVSGDLADDEDQALVRLLVENVTDTVAWLREVGVEFFGPVESIGHQTPRLHNALPGSPAYIYHLRRRALRLGVTILTNTAAESLELTDGRVTGVAASGPGGDSIRVRARRGVILAAGDFSASPQMKHDFINERYAKFLPVNPHATGDAQRMAASVGAQVLNGDVIDLPTLRLAPPPAEGLFGVLQKLPPVRALTMPIKWGLRYFPGWLIRPLMLGFVTTYLSPRELLFDEGALLVDKNGEWRSRGDESVTLTVADLGEDGGYLVGDQTLYEKFSRGENFVANAPGVARAYMPDFRRSRKDVYVEADTLQGLAQKIGVSEDALVNAVEESNRSDRGRLHPLGKPPFFALGPVRAYVLHTKGGLKVSERLEVLDGEGVPIPGLYAAGNAGQGGLVLRGLGHHLGWAFTSGRVAGRNAAQVIHAGK